MRTRTVQCTGHVKRLQPENYQPETGLHVPAISRHCPTGRWTLVQDTNFEVLPVAHWNHSALQLPRAVTDLCNFAHRPLHLCQWTVYNSGSLQFRSLSDSRKLRRHSFLSGRFDPSRP